LEWETADARTAEFDHYLTVDSTSPGYQEVGLMAVGNLGRLSGLKLPRNRLVEMKERTFCGKDGNISQHVRPAGKVLNRQSEAPTLAPLEHRLERHAHVSHRDSRARLAHIPHTPEETQNRSRCGYRGRDYRPFHERLKAYYLLPFLLGIFTVSTTVLVGLLSASFTGMNLPVSASRPILIVVTFGMFWFPFFQQRHGALAARIIPLRGIRIPSYLCP